MPHETFGVEIEIGFPPGRSESTATFEMIRDAIRATGLPCKMINSHLGSSSSEWVVKRDGSLNEQGFEVVSPPLDFNDEAQRGQVDTVVRVLQGLGCRTIKEGGIHVHIGASDLDAKQIAAVCRFIWIYEDVLYRIASSGWERIRPEALSEGAYAKPLDQKILQDMLKVKEFSDLARAWTGERTWSGSEGDRYQAINLNSYWIRGTIEFRLFNTSLNPDRVQAYIALSMAMVRDARSGHVRYTNKNYPLGYMASKDEAARYRLLVRFQQVMTTNSRDTHRLMSKQDWKRIRMCWRDSVPQPSLRELRGY